MTGAPGAGPPVGAGAAMLTESTGRLYDTSSCVYDLNELSGKTRLFQYVGSIIPWTCVQLQLRCSGKLLEVALFRSYRLRRAE